MVPLPAWTAVEPEPEAPAPEDPEQPCVDRARVDEAQGGAQAAGLRLHEVRASFVSDWGQPLQEPAGSNRADTVLGLERQLAELGLPFSEVSCEMYPCTLALSPTAEAQTRQILESLGVDAGAIQEGSVYVAGANHPIDTVALVNPTGLSVDEERWVVAVRDRHAAAAALQFASELEARAEEGR